eukprot:TRINITY_DN105366_c5_g1_i1.p1 TRINITY_DN105366_c5_g1~~TRINITY_DN105366_c5_g1_i1.p1  ORF type:complete len:828 (+),score=56.80 TRINITY_DN105366_c5_g1_i1:4867-7350(+)
MVADDSTGTPSWIKDFSNGSAPSFTTSSSTIQFWTSANGTIYYLLASTFVDVKFWLIINRNRYFLQVYNRLPCYLRQSSTSFPSYVSLQQKSQSFFFSALYLYFALNLIKQGHVYQTKKFPKIPIEYHTVKDLIEAPIRICRTDYTLKVYNSTDSTVLYNHTSYEFTPLNDSYSIVFHKLLEPKIRWPNRGKFTIPVTKLAIYKSLDETTEPGTPPPGAYQQFRRKQEESIRLYLGNAMTVPWERLKTVVIEEGRVGNEWVPSVLWVALVIAIMMIVYLGWKNREYKKQEEARSRASSSTNDKTASLGATPQDTPNSLRPNFNRNPLINEVDYKGEYPEGDRSNPFGTLDLKKNALYLNEEVDRNIEVPSPENHEYCLTSSRYPESEQSNPSNALDLKKDTFCLNERSIEIPSHPSLEKDEICLIPPRATIVSSNLLPPTSEPTIPPSFIPREETKNPLAEFARVYAKFERYLEENKYKTKYEEIEMLGKGGFAEVYMARYIVDSNIYAIKKVPVILEENDDLKQHRAYREIEAMTKLSHQNIVRYMTCWIEKGGEPFIGTNQDTQKSQTCTITHTDLMTSEAQIEWDRDSNAKRESERDSATIRKAIERSMRTYKVPLTFYIQMEYCTGSSLREWILKRNIPADLKYNRKYFEQIVSALKAIHSNGLIHRDMKPANVFLDREGNLKIGDFGLAVLRVNEITSAEEGQNATTACGLRNSHTTQAGTRLYLSPEQLAGKTYDEKVDIYSTGLILLELCCLFGTEHEKYMAFASLKEKRVVPRELQGTEEGILILKMTEENPKDRPSASEILELPTYKRWLARELAEYR